MANGQPNAGANARANPVGDFLSGILGDPALNLGIGLLAAGQSGQPLGVGLQQGLGLAQGAQALNLRNQLQRAKLGLLADERAQAARRAAAHERLRGLFGGLTGEASGIPGVDGATGADQQLLGLLAEAAPEAFTQGLLGQLFAQPREAPADIRTMDLLGIPRTPEGFQKLQSLKNDEDELLRLIQAQQASLQTQLAAQTLEDKRRAAAAEQKSEAQKAADAQSATIRGIGNVVELSGLVDRLEGSFLEPGGGADELRRSGLGAVALLGEQFGFDTGTQQRLTADYDRFVQLATGNAIENIEVLKGTGAISDRKFQTILRTFTNPNASPAAVRLALADVLEAQLDAASQFDVPLQPAERRELETLVGRLRQGGAGRGPAVGPSGDGAGGEGGVIDFDALPGAGGS